MSTNPTAIKVDGNANRLDVNWQDGHASAYDGAYLRWVCPCANCRGHYPGQVPEVKWEGIQDVRIADVKPVGSYAIQITFSDGHGTGIYSFDHLREVCPSTRDDVDEIGRPSDAS